MRRFGIDWGWHASILIESFDSAGSLVSTDTIGAGPKGVKHPGSVTADTLGRYTGENHIQDVAQQIASYKYTPVETPEKFNGDVGAFVEELYRVAATYKDTVQYAYYPTMTSQGYNSNSFVAGVIVAAGGVPPEINVPQNRFPGYTKPLPL